MATRWQENSEREAWGTWSRRPLVSGATPVGFDPAAAYLEQLGSGSRRTMREALTKLAGWASEDRCGPGELLWHRMRRDDTTALRRRLAASLAPSTANKHLAALRGVLKQCWERGMMPTEAYRAAIDLPPVRGSSARKLLRLGPDDVEALENACRRDEGPAGARDEALLGLLHGAGLRRAEAVGLELADYDLRSGELRVQRGADGRSPQRIRRIAMSDGVRSAVERWILARGAWPGPLLNPVNKGGRIERRRLSEQAIYIACQKRAAEAGLPRVSPEDLRRAPASEAEEPAWPPRPLPGRLGDPAR